MKIGSGSMATVTRTTMVHNGDGVSVLNGQVLLRDSVVTDNADARVFFNIVATSPTSRPGSVLRGNDITRNGRFGIRLQQPARIRCRCSDGVSSRPLLLLQPAGWLEYRESRLSAPKPGPISTAYDIGITWSGTRATRSRWCCIRTTRSTWVQATCSRRSCRSTSRWRLARRRGAIDPAVEPVCIPRAIVKCCG